MGRKNLVDEKSRSQEANGQTAPLERLRPAHHSMLVLQRSAGNAAVAAAILQRTGERPVMQRDDEEQTPAPAEPESAAPAAKPILWPQSEPHDFFRNRPNLLPNGGLKAPTVGPAAIDWPQLAASYTNRELSLSEPDREVIAGHWLRWYPVAQALHRLPLARSLFASPAAIMNTLTAKMIDSSLSGSNPSMIEQFNADAAKFGVSTTTLGVDLFKF